MLIRFIALLFYFSPAHRQGIDRIIYLLGWDQFFGAQFFSAIFPKLIIWIKPRSIYH